jgi:hypothetical protein
MNTRIKGYLDTLSAFGERVEAQLETTVQEEIRIYKYSLLNFGTPDPSFFGGRFLQSIAIS